MKIAKNNRNLKLLKVVDQTPHYGLRKLTLGVASVLLSTSFLLGMSAAQASANTDAVTSINTEKKC